jgi:hypothetical protein
MWNKSMAYRIRNVGRGADLRYGLMIVAVIQTQRLQDMKAAVVRYAFIVTDFQ